VLQLRDLKQESEVPTGSESSIPNSHDRGEASSGTSRRWGYTPPFLDESERKGVAKWAPAST
jgi:hypothetical protein